MSQTAILEFLQDVTAVEAAVGAMQRINIGATKTNKTVRALEDEYNAKLEKLFNEILADYKKSGMQLQDLQAAYSYESKSLIYAGVTAVYQAGIEYTGRVMDEPNVAITPKNAQTIEQLTEPIYEFFWRQIAAHIRQYEVQAFNEQTNLNIERQRLIALTTSTELISNAMMIAPLAIAEMEKYQEIRQARRGTALLTQTKTEAQKFSATVVFYTKADERVCSICFPLHGVEWDIDDPFIIIPRLMTHRRCRCRLLLKIGDRIYSM